MREVVGLKIVFLLSVGGILLALLRQRSHFLLVLLSLEVAIFFTLVIIIIMGIKVGDRGEMLVFVFLAMRACEARLGLALLVAMVRRFGNDMVKSLGVRKV